jgi:TolA-binding protein
VVEPSLEAQFYLLKGDLEYGVGSYAEAYLAYARTSILYLHPEYTPRALARSALCKEKMGDVAAAQALREQLQREYPDYRETDK